MYNNIIKSKYNATFNLTIFFIYYILQLIFWLIEQLESTK